MSVANSLLSEKTKLADNTSICHLSSPESLINDICATSYSNDVINNVHICAILCAYMRDSVRKTANLGEGMDCTK